MINGTIVNALAVIVGSVLGLVFRRLISPGVEQSIKMALGMFMIVLGMKEAITSQNLLILAFSLVLGAIVGELLLKIKIGVRNPNNHSQSVWAALILFSAGPMTLLGTLNEGLYNDPTIILTKSFLDGLTAIPLAASLGFGVLISAIPLFIIQTCLTLLASSVGSLASEMTINNISSTGGVIILAIGLNFIGVTKFNISKFVLSLVVSILLSILFSG